MIKILMIIYAISGVLGLISMYFLLNYVSFVQNITLLERIEDSLREFRNMWEFGDEWQIIRLLLVFIFVPFGWLILNLICMIEMRNNYD